MPVSMLLLCELQKRKSGVGTPEFDLKQDVGVAKVAGQLRG